MADVESEEGHFVESLLPFEFTLRKGQGNQNEWTLHVVWIVACSVDL